MAILSVLYRINPSKIYRCLVSGVAVATFAYTLVLCTIAGGPCNPLHAGTTKCLENVATAQAVLNIASDLAVIILPIPTIYNLQFSTKQKITVGCLLALGSGYASSPTLHWRIYSKLHFSILNKTSQLIAPSVVICSIARLPYVLELGKSPDITYTEAILGVWSIVEVNLGIICACAMRFKRLIATYLPRLSIFSSRSRGTGKITEESSVNRFQAKNNRAQDSYELHSFQSGSMDPLASSRDISVHHTLTVDEERMGVYSGDDKNGQKILE